MSTKHQFTFLAYPACVMLCVILLSPALAQNSNDFDGFSLKGADTNQSFNLVQNSDVQEKSKPPSGTLVLPETLIPTNKEEKKCMTVCAQWGEDCTYINRGSGGMTRNCRRTCQQFTQECF